MGVWTRKWRKGAVFAPRPDLRLLQEVGFSRRENLPEDSKRGETDLNGVSDFGFRTRCATIDSMEIIYPRSPRETMCGWMHLPRFIDKLRLHFAGKLHPDYQDNLCKGFDGLWLQSAGVNADEFKAVVRNSITDGQVCDWVLKNVHKSEAEKAAHRQKMLNHPSKDDAAMQARLKMRKEEAGLGHRNDIATFVDFIDADEKRI